MATVSDIMAGKGDHLVTVSAQASVYQAALLMNEQRIGALLVLVEGRLVGILTERDIMARVVATQRCANETRVEEVMTRDVVCCHPHTSLEEVQSTMKNRRIRHLPVVSDDGVAGMLSIGDVNAFQVDCQERTIHLLEDYIHGTR